MAAEVTVATPLLIALLVFVAIVIHRGVDARLRLDDAAHQAARAASIARTAPGAVTAAASAATDALSSAGTACRALTVDTNTVNFTPGGTVTVTLTCTVDLSGAQALAVPATKILSATATEPVDTWRALNTAGGGS